MHTPGTVHVAMGIAALSAVFSTFALFGSQQRSPGLRPTPGESPGIAAGEARALRAELAGLRAELEELRRTLRSPSHRSPMIAAEAPQEKETASDEVVSAAAEPGAGPALPARFNLREELLENYPYLSGGDRADALRELGELARWGDPEARALLLEGLQDPSSSVRRRALRELAELADPALVERRPAMVADRNGEVREAAAEALGRMPVESAGPILVGLLGDRRETVVLEALRALDRLDYEEAGPAVRAVLASNDLDLAARAASLLRELGDKEATGHVVTRVLEHYARSSVSGRLNDVKRLRALRARAELRDILEKDESASVRFEAQKALAGLDD